MIPVVVNSRFQLDYTNEEKKWMNGFRAKLVARNLVTVDLNHEWSEKSSARQNISLERQQLQPISINYSPIHKYYTAP